MSFDLIMTAIGSVCLILFEILQYRHLTGPQQASEPVENPPLPDQSNRLTKGAKVGMAILFIGILGFGWRLFRETQTGGDYSGMGAAIALLILGSSLVLGLIFSGLYTAGRSVEGHGKLPGAGILFATGFICLVMGMSASYLRETLRYVYGIPIVLLFIGSVIFRRFRK